MRLPDGVAIVSVVIPCLNEEEPIAGVVTEVLAQGVDEVIVVDNGSTDATAARAAASRRARGERAAPRLWPRLRGGRSRRCARDAEIVCFLDGDGSDVPAFLAAWSARSRAGEADFVMGSRLRGKREAGSMTPQQLVAGHLAGVLMRLVYGVRFTDMSPFRAMRVARAARARHDRGHLWLEPGNADARRRRRPAHPRDPGRSSLPPRRRFEGLGQSDRGPRAPPGRSPPRSCGSQ